MQGKLLFQGNVQNLTEAKDLIFSALVKVKEDINRPEGFTFIQHEIDCNLYSYIYAT